MSDNRLRQTKTIDARAGQLQAKLGQLMEGTVGQNLHAAQQIAWLEDSCKSIVEAIHQLDELAEDEDSGGKLNEVRAEAQFLRTLLNDRSFLRSLEFAVR